MISEEQVSRWRTTDGSVFATLREAEVYEAKEALAKMIDRKAAYGDINVNDAVQLLCDEAREVVRLLCVVAGT